MLKEDISYGELADCCDYANRVIEYYKEKYNGELPLDMGAAQWGIDEYSRKHTFKSLYGYSRNGYTQTIIDSIGFIVES